MSRPEETATSRVDSLPVARQRGILRILREQSAPMTITEVARKIRQSDRHLTDDLSGVMKDDLVRLRVYHIDVPKLSQAGLVDYDPDQKVVQLTEQTRCGEFQTVIAETRSDEEDE